MEQFFAIKSKDNKYSVEPAVVLLRRPEVSVVGFGDGSMKIIRNQYLYNSSERAIKDCMILNKHEGK